MKKYSIFLTLSSDFPAKFNGLIIGGIIPATILVFCSSATF
jgi:hypothetical protein